MSKKKLPEVLAPAKNLILAKSALANGADAVYFAGEKFGARAYADNFSEADALSLIDHCHIFGKKAYLTVNTLLKDPEMENQLYRAILPLYKQGLDGVIVQDFGVFSLFKSCFPKLHLHASTQTNVTTAQGAAWWEKVGAKRVVLARELSIEEIADIRKNCDIELEVFVHGALCVCYSGQCLMSSMIGGRSGNRGACAQPCRLAYDVLDKNRKKLSGGKSFPLSPKDLCGIDVLPQLYEAGVSSLKIEGRMKSLYYVNEVSRIYREYVDRLAESGSTGYTVDEKDRLRLKNAGNRGGFTNAYYFAHNDTKMMALSDSAHHVNSEAAKKEMATEFKMPISAVFSAVEGKPFSLTMKADAAEVIITDGRCERAQKRATTKEEILEKLEKTGDFPFVLSENRIVIDADVFVPMKLLNAMRRKAMEEMLEQMTAPYRREDESEPGKLRITDDKKMQETANSLFGTRSSVGDRGKPIITVSVRNAEQLAVAGKTSFSDRIVVSFGLWDEADKMIRKTGKLKSNEQKKSSGKRKEIVFSLPEVIRKKDEKVIEAFVEKHKDGLYEVQSYDALGLLAFCDIDPSQIFGGVRLYAWSNRTRESFAALGLERLCVPTELSAKELMHRENWHDTMLLYGHLPLMLTANCIRKNTLGCDKNPGLLYIRDEKGYAFPVENDCALCTNRIYNALPLCLFDEMEMVKKLDAGAWELAFTMESGETMQKIMDMFYAVFFDGERMGKLADHTKGHFRRGVKE